MDLQLDTTGSDRMDRLGRLLSFSAHGSLEAMSTPSRRVHCVAVLRKLGDAWMMMRWRIRVFTWADSWAAGTTNSLICYVNSAYKPLETVLQRCWILR